MYSIRIYTSTESVASTHSCGVFVVCYLPFVREWRSLWRTFVRGKLAAAGKSEHRQRAWEAPRFEGGHPWEV